MSILTRAEVEDLYRRNAGKRVWIEHLGWNDLRLVIRNEDEMLYCFWSAEYDIEEQAHAARLCAHMNRAITSSQAA